MKAPLTAKAWLFDLDGTLVDTAPDLGQAANHVRKECGLPALPLVDYRPAASSGARGLLKVALDMEPDHAEFPVRRDSLLAFYRANIAVSSKPFPGISELLLALRLKNIKWGVVTNKPGWLTQPLLKELGMAEHAASVVSGDSTPNPKPAPDSLLLACDQISLKPEDCIYVGDDARDITAARNAGMPSVAAAWGYIGQTQISQWGADIICNSVADLHGLLA